MGCRQVRENETNNHESYPDQELLKDQKWETKYRELIEVLPHYQKFKGAVSQHQFHLLFKLDIEHMNRLLRGIRPSNNSFNQEKHPRFQGTSLKTHRRLMDELSSKSLSMKEIELLIVANGPSQNMLERKKIYKFIEEGNHVLRMNHINHAAFDKIPHPRYKLTTRCLHEMWTMMNIPAHL